MHGNIHLMVATSTSIIMTFVIHSIMEYTLSTQSFLQRYVIDFCRNYVLVIPCLYNEGISMNRFFIMMVYYYYSFSN